MMQVFIILLLLLPVSTTLFGMFPGLTTGTVSATEPNSDVAAAAPVPNPDKQPTISAFAVFGAIVIPEKIKAIPAKVKATSFPFPSNIANIFFLK